jgi:uncharacterized delta-60 repeat protein
MRRLACIALAALAACRGLLAIDDKVLADDAGTDDAAADAPAQTDSEAGSTIRTGAVLTLTKASRWVRAGGESQVDFRIARNGVDGQMRVHVDGLPPGVSAEDVDVAGDAGSGTITLASGSSAPLGASASANVSLFASTQEEDTKKLDVLVTGDPGSADVTWGDAGTVSLAVPNAPRSDAIALSGDKILVAGIVNVSATDVRIFLARFATDGALDTTFGDLGGYTIFDPGPSDPVFPTYLGGMKVDSKGRIAIANGRYVAGHCAVELSRWSSDGTLDGSFTRFSGSLDGSPCGGVIDVAVAPKDDIAMLGRWNEVNPLGTTVSVVQLFSGSTGARIGSTAYRIFLDTSGGEKSTRGVGLAVDYAGRFLVSGAQCDGGWSSNTYACTSVVARLTVNGGPDDTFGGSSGYVPFPMDGGATQSQTFLRLAIDPKSNDIITAGTNENGTLGTLARIRSADGTPAFASPGTITRDLLTGATSQSIFRPFVDSEGRIVVVANVATTQNAIVSARAHADGSEDATWVPTPTIGIGFDAALDAVDRLYVVGSKNGGPVVFRFWP